MDTITTEIPSRLIRIFRMMAWVGLIVFAVGAPISVSLETIGASLAIVSSLPLLVLGDIRPRRSGIDIPILLLLLGTVSSPIITSPDKLNSFFSHLPHYGAILFFFT